MSMISAQCDELRRYADMEDGTFPLLASALRDAADTIWELRDDLQRANAAVQDAEHDESMAWDRVRKAEAENAKLVDVLHEVEEDAIYAYHCLQQDCVTTANSSEHFFKKWWHAECELDRANAENDKLRELVRFIMHQCNEGNPRCDDCIDWNDGECVALLRMRELGVEVDG